MQTLQFLDEREEDTTIRNFVRDLSELTRFPDIRRLKSESTKPACAGYGLKLWLID